MQKSVFLIAAVFLFSFFINAQTTYYVSSSDGNNSYSGKSSSSPWKTLSKLNSVTFRAGDRILFKKGDIWREQLNITSSGSSSSPIELNVYGSGNTPRITGANYLTGFVKHSGYIWKKYISSPQQIFFSSVRGIKQSSLSNVNSAREWYWSSNYLYIYSTTTPSGIEYTTRRNGIYVTGDNINIHNLQIEKVTSSAIHIASSASRVIIDNIQIYQWSNAVNGVIAGVNIDGSYSQVKNSTFGKTTGNDFADQGWAGLVGIVINGKNNSVLNNKLYHSAIENESRNGIYGAAIRVTNAGGTTRVANNYIYHPGSHGIYVGTNSRSGDLLHINDNTIEYPGQAGISLYKTRKEDGVGGKGYVYGNKISFANRLGGDVGGNGTQASGIHFNDGARSGTQSGKPYMKWYCYENTVRNSQALKVPNSPDSGGISMDFNANYVEVYRNLVYNNYGKGIYIWNANNCKLYYNIVYGNDAGTSVSALRGGVETADNNAIYNNTYYKNYNGSGKGPNLDTEIFFGFNGDKNIIKNNILYASNYGYSLFYNATNTSGHVIDNNVLYSERGIVARDSYYGEQTFAKWKANHPSWDRYSVGANPQLNNTSNFTLKSTSPAINKGAVLGLLIDYLGKALSGAPDIGAVEYGSSSSVGSSGGGSNIIINTSAGTLTGGAKLGSKSGSKNAKILYFENLEGEAKYIVNLPSSGNWYAWGRVYYSSESTQNSFFIKPNNGSRRVLGNDDHIFNQWYWGGYLEKRINLGTMNAGTNTITISAREPGLTLWVDQIILTMDTNYDPNKSLGKENSEEENNETEETNTLPTAFEVSQNYPNPFNPSTKIKYAVPANSHVSLKIYDILGAEVANLVDEVKSPGYYEVTFDGKQLSSGIYIYQLRTRDFVQSRKMNLVK